MIETVGELKRWLDAVNDDVLLRFYGSDKNCEEIEVVGKITDIDLSYDWTDDNNYLYLISRDLG